MGLLDQFTQLAGNFLSNPQNQKQSPLINLVSQFLNSSGSSNGNGLLDLIQNFQNNGLGDVISSWVNTGENRPISSQDIQRGLGEETIRRWSSEVHLSETETSNQLSQILPQLVDRLTPQGNIPEGNELDAVLTFLQSKLK